MNEEEFELLSVSVLCGEASVEEAAEHMTARTLNPKWEVLFGEIEKTVASLREGASNTVVADPGEPEEIPEHHMKALLDHVFVPTPKTFANGIVVREKRRGHERYGRVVGLVSQDGTYATEPPPDEDCGEMLDALTRGTSPRVRFECVKTDWRGRPVCDPFSFHHEGRPVYFQAHARDCTVMDVITLVEDPSLGCYKFDSQPLGPDQIPSNCDEKGICENLDLPEPHPDDEIWVHQRGMMYGPFLVSEVKEYLKTGKLCFADMIWYNGLEQWEFLSSVSGFREVSSEVVAEDRHPGLDCAPYTPPT